MSTAGKSAAAVIAATLAAGAYGAPDLVMWEGWVNRGYPDLVGKATACAGVTEAITVGRAYNDEECTSRTAVALVKHGLAIAPCLPAEMPTPTRAAFMLAAYNIGVSAFCGSSMSRLAVKGDLRGACAALSMWNKATVRGVKVAVPGLTNRRTHERAMCERGLKA